MLKHLISPVDENDIFLSTSIDKVTWKELDERLDEKVSILKEHGLSSHVAFIIQENNKITIDDLLWILASIKNGGSASNAEDTASQKELDYLIQGSNANCVIRSNKIEIVKDPSLGSTKMHSNEIFRGMTSGTTVKEMFEIYPYFWTFEDHMNSVDFNEKTLIGCTIESTNRMLLNVAPEFNGYQDERPVILQPSGFTSTYSPYNLLRAYQLGARLHHLNIGDDIIKEIDEVKPNCILSFPNALKRTIDALPEDRKLIFCDETLENRNISECLLLEKPEKIALLVGPEGGFSHMERNLLKTKKNILPVSLGNRILRAETAAVAALTMWHGMVGDWINRVGHLNYES